MEAMRLLRLFASGTLAETFKRGKTDWAEARAIVTVWETARSWEGDIPKPPVLVDPAAVVRVTIERAIAVFLSGTGVHPRRACYRCRPIA
jgi:hypothetical protein